ncbi:putative ORFan [Tupanvirus deep ocean]|uniref:ORFan n=2 Tax=Tupanvirus TaxID=2094720 RepID=A0AC62A7S9_9VIRU|nr:putative ORFan [Tupanvirus deep ocean]QKU33733.1 putative ORFan [Tupanvirus deep ocean]
MTKTTIIIIAVIIIIIIIVLMLNGDNNNDSMYGQVPIDTFKTLPTYPYVSSTYDNYFNKVYANDPTYAQYLENVYGAYNVNFHNGNDHIAQSFANRDPAVVNDTFLNDPAVVGGGKPTNRGVGTVYGTLSSVPTGGIKMYNRYPSVVRRREYFDDGSLSIENAPTIANAPNEVTKIPNTNTTIPVDGVFIPSDTNCLTVLPGKLVISATQNGLSVNQESDGVPTLYAPGSLDPDYIAAEHYCNIGLNEPDSIFGKVKPYDQDMHIFGKSKDYDSYQSQNDFELLNN